MTDSRPTTRPSGSVGATRRWWDAAPLPGTKPHVRRKFIEADSSAPEACAEILDLIGDLYEIESRARDPDADEDLLERTARLRREESTPKLDQIRAWAAAQSALPRSLLGKAIKNLVGQWPRLVRYVENPRIWIDNNPTERAIRGPVVGSKNHYGSKSRRGTEVAAIIYSLVETAKACGVDPREYLRRLVANDIRNPHIVTWPEPIEKVMGDE